MNPTPDETSERILKRIAKRLLRCPFDEELFDSTERLSEHLLACHPADICRKQRIPKQESLGDIERPTKLTFCGHCLGHMVPDALGRYASSEISRHIREAHPNPNGSAVITMRFSSDPAPIDRFIEDQVSPEVCLCSEPGCGELFNSEANVAAHWAEMHCYPPKIDGVRRLLEIEPERFEPLLEECFKAEHDLEQTRLRQSPVPEDSYLVRRQPCVPRIRSRQSEFIVYIEGEKLTLRREDYDEMVSEGEYHSTDYEQSEQQGPQRTVRLELRSTNIQDGYVPLVKALNRLLMQTETIQVSWQDEPDVFFPCIVNRTKEAIYNLEGKLKQAFGGLPSGVILYITKVDTLRYEFRLKAEPHTVMDCKVFVPMGENRWRVETQNLELQWETGDVVFRHQSTFDEMPALHQEAQQTGLSVRDAVYEYMREEVKDAAVSIKEVYDFVFWLMRTCSRAAVWSQFRKEHECYVRVEPGRYRFDESKPLPRVRVVRTATADARQSAERVVTGEHAPGTKIVIIVRWSKILNSPRQDEEFSKRNSGESQARFLGSLFKEFGPDHRVSKLLTHVHVSGSKRLSDNPAVDFFNHSKGAPYPNQQVPGTNLYLYTNTDNQRKQTDILNLVQTLGFPSDSVTVRIVPKRTRLEEILNL